MNSSARLIILPCEPGNFNGYTQAVLADLERLRPQDGDRIIYRTRSLATSRPNTQIIPVSGKFNLFINTVKGRPPFEVRSVSIKKCLKNDVCDFHTIFAGDTIFYKAIRNLYPNTHILVRFHNLFSLAKHRQLLHSYPIDWKFKIILKNYSNLEKEILLDPNVTPIFITQEDMAFAEKISPRMKGLYWSVVDAALHPSGKILPPTKPRLVFFGTASPSHTAVGIRYLCKKIFHQIHKEMPHCELHLFGVGTHGYTDRVNNIFGHGRFTDTGLPFDGNALFCIPDLHGCGVKMKVYDLLEANVPFISTPVGVSGYAPPDSMHIIVEDIENWPKRICEYFENLSI